MAIVEEDFYSYKDPEKIVPYGMGIVSFGLTQGDVSNGYGLLTRGLLWQLYQIWLDVELYDSISTSWTDSDSVITTTWTNDNASITTNWSDEGELNGF